MITKSVFHVPMAQATTQAAIHTPTERVFDCAQRRLDELRKQDALWDAKVTLRDLSAGILETGDFSEDNVTGFRVRLAYRHTTGTIDLRMKGAGAYFVDLGVDQALAQFNQGFNTCLANRQ